jgi:GNAT superfamily N-acetyltransferase
MKLSFATATEADALSISLLRNRAAYVLTQKHGSGYWSNGCSEKTVLFEMRSARVVIARYGERVVGTLGLGARKPWAIDPDYFTKARKPFYLTAMAVDPEVQRQGIGRNLIEAAKAIAQTEAVDAIRLDAWNAEAGAGAFYAKCGFREVGRVTYRKVPLIYFEVLL